MIFTKTIIFPGWEKIQVTETDQCNQDASQYIVVHTVQYSVLYCTICQQ